GVRLHARFPQALRDSAKCPRGQPRPLDAGSQRQVGGKEKRKPLVMAAKDHGPGAHGEQIRSGAAVSGDRETDDRLQRVRTATTSPNLMTATCSTSSISSTDVTSGPCPCPQ